MNSAMRGDFGAFLGRRAELTDPGQHPENRDDQIRTDAMMGVGLLIGAGFPAAASAVSLLLEYRFQHDSWLWNAP
jgi:hypothetical protein